MYKGPLYIAADHAGFKLKKRLIRYIENELDLKIEDMGASEFDENDDYPDFIYPCAVETIKNSGRCIVIGGSGNGEAIVANKVKGMRCALCHSTETAELSRQHNDANGIALGGRILTDDHAMAIIKTWLKTEFEGGRHERRLKKISDYEKK
ncbi:RpiB/LacA/LacB family sugar-phosphate isomerase [Patescibacteria group bacterium]|nr:RpiB/LacA/LacB family sugar-phosphate isomerase [Patescibacteria group bacterium]MBU1895540.1 RpiB/LacA/LacB family sugar-phosphate isomerase [Patescibacteria group bacterium]